MIFASRRKAAALPSVRSALLVRLLGFAVMTGGSMPSYAADLLDIYRLALRNDPTFEVARYSLKAAQEKQPQAVAQLLPSLSVNGSNNVTRAHTQFTNTFPVSRDVHAWNWSLQLTQPLIRMQGIYAYDEGKALAEQAQAQYNLAQQEMMLRIAQAYFDVLSAREEIKVVEAELAASVEQLEQTRNGFEKGIAAVTDVRESQARVDLAKSHGVAARNTLDAKNAELEKIVDNVPEYLAPLNPVVDIPIPQPSDQGYWVELARENNQAVRAAWLGLRAAEAVVSKSRAEHIPTLDLVASYGENYSSGSTTMPTDFASKGQVRQIGIQFNVPLFAGGAPSSHVAEAMANKYRAGAELELAKRQAATDARLAHAGVMNGLSQIMALRSSVASAQAMVDASHAGYKRGIYNNFKLLDAEQQLYTAKRDLIKARYETLFQALKLKAASGALSEGDLIAANSLLSQP
ncbi:MAG: TolC family outer membrane protein [Halothiobacillaceae bacterium]|nr:TolC family outer membrane protein [Halothiobacillaceae bacterium]